MSKVGIAISKGKSTVALLRLYGEIISSPFEVKHAVSGIRSKNERQQKLQFRRPWSHLSYHCEKEMARENEKGGRSGDVKRGR